jgi:DNA-directed RNA polymerase subunit RPC12/RpoP
MKCPHCGQEIGIGTAALAGHAYLLRTQCEKCGKEYLILDGFPITEEQYSSQLSDN